MVIHLGRLWPYLQAIDEAGKASQGETLELITEIRILRPQYVIAGACTIKLFTAVIYDFRNKLECLSLARLSSLVQWL